MSTSIVSAPSAARDGRSAPSQSPVDRWVDLVGRVVVSPTDVATLNDWADGVNMSIGTLSNRCRAVGAAPKDSWTLGRLLRALVLAHGATWQPETVLTTMDPRTWMRIRRKVGDAGDGCRPTLEEILIGPNWRIPLSIRAALREGLRVWFPWI